jgi:hypothetical protein
VSAPKWTRAAAGRNVKNLGARSSLEDFLGRSSEKPTVGPPPIAALRWQQLPTCLGTNKNGTPCKAKAVRYRGSSFCATHRPKGDFHAD